MGEGLATGAMGSVVLLQSSLKSVCISAPIAVNSYTLFQLKPVLITALFFLTPMTHSHTCSHLASGCPAPREVQLTSNHQPSRKQVRMRSPSLGILKSSPMFCPDSYAEGSAKGGLGLGLATGWVPPWHLPQSLGAVQTSSSPSLPSLTSTSKC